jgi:hypothetical protein
MFLAPFHVVTLMIAELFHPDNAAP